MISLVDYINEGLFNFKKKKKEPEKQTTNNKDDKEVRLTSNISGPLSKTVLFWEDADKIDGKFLKELCLNREVDIYNDFDIIPAKKYSKWDMLAKQFKDDLKKNKSRLVIISYDSEREGDGEEGQEYEIIGVVDTKK